MADGGERSNHLLRRTAGSLLALATLLAAAPAALAEPTAGAYVVPRPRPPADAATANPA